MTGAHVMAAPAAARVAQGEALARWAVLVPVPAGTKGPRAEGWDKDPAQWITTPEQARAYLTRHPGAGVGLLHSEAQTATLDIDHDGAALALAAVGADLQALLNGNPYRVRGKKGEKPVYRVPDGLSLKRRALSWPDPTGKKGPGGRVRPVTIFELRGGPGCQDVMPPSIHPETGEPYAWVGPVPASLDDLPALPDVLLSLWERWAALEPVMRAACPWAPAQAPEPAARDLARLGSASGAHGGGVVDTFNASRSLAEVLAAHGYTGPQRGPWVYPGSSTGQAGVRLRPERTPRGAEVVMSWHAADPLGDGLPRDAFSVWALLEHGVNLYAAPPERVRDVVKAAARHLGLPEPERGRAEGGTPGRTAADLPALDWGEVGALPDLTAPVPSLPPELLPAPLAAWIQAEARGAGLPLEMVAAPVMVGAGGLIGHRLTLRNARNAPAVPANLWGAICGPPSIKKSHALNLGAAALNRLQRAEFERLDAQRGELEAHREKVTAHRDALTLKVRHAAQGKGGQNAPSMPSDDELSAAREAVQEAEAALLPARYVVNDSTVEKLGEIMAQNPDGVTLIKDELTGWLKTFDKAGRESDRAAWLEFWNGTGSVTVDRMSRGTLYIPRACAGVMGTIQPGPLAVMLGELHGAGDGLLQRFQVFIWPDTFPPFDQAAQREPIPQTVRDAAAAVLDALPGLNLDALGTGGAPLTYTPEAQAVYDAWEVQNAAQARDGQRGEAYRAHLGKQPRTFAQLATVLHALDVAAAGGPEAHPHPAQVGEVAALQAQAWCEYLAAHIEKLWGEGRRRDVLDARDVLRFIERGRVLDGQKLGEVRRVLADSKAGFTGERLRAALGVLQSCGAVRVERGEAGPKGGRPVETLRIHPDALQALDVSGAGGAA